MSVLKTEMCTVLKYPLPDIYLREGICLTYMDLYTYIIL